MSGRYDPRMMEQHQLSPARARKRALENMYHQDMYHQEQGVSPSVVDGRDDESVDSIEALVQNLEAKGYDLSRGGASFYSVGDDSEEDADDRYKVERNATFESLTSREPPLDELPIYRSPTPPRRKVRTVKDELRADVHQLRDDIIQTVFKDDEQSVISEVDDGSFVSESSSLFSWRHRRNATDRKIAEPSLETVREVTREPVREPAREPARKSARAPARAPAREPARESTQEPTREPTRVPARKATKKPAREPTRAVREPSKQSTKVSAKTSTREPPPRVAGRRKRQLSSRELPATELPKTAAPPKKTKISKRNESKQRREQPPPQPRSESQPRNQPTPRRKPLRKQESVKSVGVRRKMASTKQKRSLTRQGSFWRKGAATKSEPSPGHASRPEPKIAPLPKATPSQRDVAPPAPVPPRTKALPRILPSPMSSAKEPQPLTKLPLQSSPRGNLSETNVVQMRQGVISAVLNEENSILSAGDDWTNHSDGSSTYDDSLFSEESSMRFDPPSVRGKGVFDQIFGPPAISPSRSDSLESNTSSTIYSEAPTIYSEAPTVFSEAQSTMEPSLWGDIVDEVKDFRFPWSRQKAQESTRGALGKTRSADDSTIASSISGSGLSLTEAGIVGGGAVATGAFAATAAAAYATSPARIPEPTSTPEAAIAKVVQPTVSQNLAVPDLENKVNTSGEIQCGNRKGKTLFGKPKAPKGKGSVGYTVIPGKVPTTGAQVQKSSSPVKKENAKSSLLLLNSGQQSKKKGVKGAAKLDGKIKASETKKKKWRKDVMNQGTSGLETIEETGKDESKPTNPVKTEEMPTPKDVTTESKTITLDPINTAEPKEKDGDDDQSWLNSPSSPIAALALAGGEMFAFASSIIEGAAVDEGDSHPRDALPRNALFDETTAHDDATEKVTLAKSLNKETGATASSGKKRRFGLFGRKKKNYESIFNPEGSPEKVSADNKSAIKKSDSGAAQGKSKKRKFWSRASRTRKPTIFEEDKESLLSTESTKNQTSDGSTTQPLSEASQSQVIPTTSKPSLFSAASIAGIGSIAGIASIASLGASPRNSVGEETATVPGDNSTELHNNTAFNWCCCGSSPSFTDTTFQTAPTYAGTSLDEQGGDALVTNMCQDNANLLKETTSKEDQESVELVTSMCDDNINQLKETNSIEETAPHDTEKQTSILCPGASDTAASADTGTKDTDPVVDSSIFCFGGAAALGTAACCLASSDESNVENDTSATPVVQDVETSNVDSSQAKRGLFNRFRKPTKDISAADSGTGTEQKQSFASWWKKNDVEKSETPTELSISGDVTKETETSTADQPIETATRTGDPVPIETEAETKLPQPTESVSVEPTAASTTEFSGASTQLSTNPKGKEEIVSPLKKKKKGFRMWKPRNKKVRKAGEPTQSGSTIPSTAANNVSVLQTETKQVDTTQTSEGLETTKDLDATQNTEPLDDSRNSATTDSSNDVTLDSSAGDGSVVSQEESNAALTGSAMMACLAAPCALWWLTNSEPSGSTSQEDEDEKKGDTENDREQSYWKDITSFCSPNASQASGKVKGDTASETEDSDTDSSASYGPESTVAESQCSCYSSVWQEDEKTVGGESITAETEQVNHATEADVEPDKQLRSQPLSQAETGVTANGIDKETPVSETKADEDESTPSGFFSIFSLCDSLCLPKASVDVEADVEADDEDGELKVSDKVDSCETETETKEQAPPQTESVERTENTEALQGAACACAAIALPACWFSRPADVPNVLSEDTTGSDGRTFWKSITNPNPTSSPKEDDDDSDDDSEDGDGFWNSLTNSKKVDEKDSSATEKASIAKEAAEADSSNSQSCTPYNPCVGAACCWAAEPSAADPIEKKPSFGDKVRSKLTRNRSEDKEDVDLSADEALKRKFSKKRSWRKKKEPEPEPEGVLGFVRQISKKFAEDTDTDTETNSVSADSIREIQKAIRVVKRHAKRSGLSEKEIVDVIGEGDQESGLIGKMGKITDDFFNDLDANLSMVSAE